MIYSTLIALSEPVSPPQEAKFETSESSDNFAVCLSALLLVPLYNFKHS